MPPVLSTEKFRSTRSSGSGARTGVKQLPVTQCDSSGVSRTQVAWNGRLIDWLRGGHTWLGLEIRGAVVVELGGWLPGGGQSGEKSIACAAL